MSVPPFTLPTPPPPTGARSPSALITPTPTTASSSPTTPMCQDGDRRIASPVRQHLAEWQARIPARGHLCHASPSQQFHTYVRSYPAIVKNGGCNFSATLAHTFVKLSPKPSLEREPMQERIGLYISSITCNPLTPDTQHKSTITRNNGFISKDTGTLLHALSAARLNYDIEHWALAVCLPAMSSLAANDYLLSLFFGVLDSSPKLHLQQYYTDVTLNSSV